MKKKSLVGIASLVIVAAGASHVMADDPKTDPTFRVLNGPREPLDLPNGSELAQRVNAESATKAGRIDSADVFLTRGTDQSNVCLVARDPEGITAGCFALDTLKNRPGTLAWQLSEGGDVTVATLVPDAYDSAEIAGKDVKVQNNVALTTTRPGDFKVKLNGRTGSIEEDFSAKPGPPA